MTTLTSSHYEVCEASPGDCLEDCLSVFNATRPHESQLDRFEWLYQANPDGEAVVWLVRAVESGEVVGFTAAVPRRMLVNGTEMTGWIGSDFSILPKYRTLGLAVKLRRAARVAIDDGRADFLYAHPNDRMAAIHKRVGHQSVGTMVRLAKPLRTGPYLADATGSKWLGTAASLVLDPVRRLTDRGGRMMRNGSVHLDEDARFDSRFDDLFRESTRGFAGNVGVRDADYLNWRYVDNPLYQTHVLTLKRDGQLAGYVLFVKQGAIAQVKDVFPMRDADVSLSLLTALIRTGYTHGWQSISSDFWTRIPYCRR